MTRWSTALISAAAMSIGVLPAHAEPATPQRAAAASVALPSLPNRLAFTTMTYTHGPDDTYTQAAHGIGTIGFDGSDPRVLTNPDSPNWDFGPQWSPDGCWLAFTRDDQESRDKVAIIPRDGGALQVLTTNGFLPTWAPDGQRLAWIAEADDGTESIVVADLEESCGSATVADQRAVLTIGTTSRINNLQFSPDGQTLAFIEWNQDPDVGDVFSVPATGGAPRHLTHGQPVEPTDKLSWSPDGTKLLYEVDVDADPQGIAPRAFIVNSDGSNAHQAAHEDADEYDMEAAWLPSGLGVGLVSNLDAYGIRIVSLGGVTLAHLASNAFAAREGLTFSADGTLAYLVGGRKKDPAWPPAPPELYAVPLSGAPILRLTSDESVWGQSLQAFDPGKALRLGVGNAVEDALALSRQLFTSAANVIITLASRPLDALAASPLAAKLHAPILVVDGDGVTQQLLDELKRLGASTAYLVGDVPADVMVRLVAAGLQTQTVGLSDDPDTVASAVAQEVRGTHAVVAVRSSGSAWATPLAAAGFAVARRRPMLYADATQLPSATREALRRNGTTRVTLAVPGSIDPQRLVNQLKALGITATVVTGSRYAISAKLAAKAARAAGTTRRMVISSGATWRSSIASAAAAGSSGISLLVPARGKLAKPTREVVTQEGADIGRAWISGGVSSVGPQVETALERLL